jgi:hypothetical protein
MRQSPERTQETAMARRITGVTVIVVCAVPGMVMMTLRGQGDEVLSPKATPGIVRSEVAAGENIPDDQRTPSPTEARQRAELLHEFVHETLLAVHHHYYREDEGMLLPATTMRGVFEKFGQSRGVQLRWLAVDAEPMNVEHAAKDDFERAAVKALKSGEKLFESVSADQYRYAGPIVLTSECLKCHVPNRTSVRDRLAGIVISMPRIETMPRIESSERPSFPGKVPGP